MLIEAVDHPIRYRFPGGEIRLEPGRPVEVEPKRAAKLLARAGAKVRAITPVMHPGDRISWTRGDLTVQHGVVDFLHTDPDGTSWAFVTYEGTWCAVNTRFVTEAPWRNP
ncbi:MAG TPA: hypothetical protein VGQ08_13275 [Nitrospiraceae bacterium]|jgi:hypothetical protein|nr:hypothetical protein [Nitrospiraceae bacterium]